MSPEPTVSAAKPYPVDSLDYNRVEERASHASYRMFWSAFKGHVRGSLAGSLIGVVLGTAIGIAMAVALPELGAATTLIAGAAGMGALMTSKVYGDAGSASGTRAAGLAESHSRILDPTHKGVELATLDDKLMMGGHRHHWQYPENRDKGKFYNWKSGTVGALALAGLGALLGMTGTLSQMALFAGVTATGGEVVLGAALAMGTLGLAFGIDRSNLKSIFNQVDANTRGEIYLGDFGKDLGKEQYKGKETDAQLAQHRLDRQASTDILEKEYQDKIFAGSVKGMFRGFAGGAVAGALIGAALGALAFAAASATGVAEAIGIAKVGETVLAGCITAAKLFAGAGALYAMKTFGDAGREAGAESTARAIDNEFQRNQELRERGITPAPPTPTKKRYLNIEAALLMGAIGVGIGLLAPGLVAPSMQAASALICGTIGAMYGIGSDSLKFLSRATDWVYDKTFLADNTAKAHPYVSVGQDSFDRPVDKPTVTVPREEMALLDERLQQRQQRSFGQTVIATPMQTSTSPTL